MSSFIPSLDSPPVDDLSLENEVPLEPAATPETIEIQYVDTRPEEEREYETPTSTPETSRFTDRDKQQYGKNVKKRLGQMDYAVHEAERQRDQAIRERQALEDHARSLATQLQEMKGREAQWGNMAVDATRSQLDSQINSTKREIAQMLQSAQPDAAKVVDGQERLSTLVAQRAQVATLRTDSAGSAAPAPTQPAAAAGAPLQHPSYNYDRERWLAVNPWFGKDLDKTQKLVGIEQNLVSNGVVMGSRAYWDAIERAKQMVFNGNVTGSAASRTGSPSVSQTRPVVTGSARGAAPQGQSSTTGNRRVVQLSQDERRAAARMGVSEQAWAEEKWKRQEKQRANG